MSNSSNSEPEASARLDSAFERALAKFKEDNLTEREGDEFQWGTLDELKTSIKEIQADQVSKNKNRNLNRVKAFLEGMEQYEEIIKVFLNTCNYLAFVWGPMKFLLQVTSNFVNAFDALLDMYNEIGEQLGLLGKYQALFREKPHMMNVLEMIYVDILEFHAKALSYFRQKRWKQLFHHTWRNFRTRFNETIQNFKRHKSLIESQATLAQFEEICAIRKHQAEQLTLQREEAAKRRAQAVRAWLAAESMSVHQDHFSTLRHEYPGSGEWILKKNRVRQWLDLESAGKPLLWLTGIPGAGKTFLASTLIEELQKRTGVHVLFFYCKYETVGRNCFMDIARSLLQQCCLGDERLQEYIEAKSSGEDILRKSQAKELLDVAIRRKNKTFIIIDGIDECKKEEKAEIVSWLRGIVEGDWGRSDSDEEDAENEDEETVVRGMIVGQEDNDSWRLLRNLPVVKIEPGDNGADILRFCRNGESKIKARFDTGSLDVAATVAKYAAGMFLFARLVMSNLRTQISQHRFEQDMKWVTEGTVVDKITEKLDLVYGRIITRVIEEAEEAERDGALQLLGILVSAQRDLAWHEIQGLLAVDLAGRLIDVKRHMSVDSKDLCGSLVEVRSGHTVTLVHTSAEHYLVKCGIVSVSHEHVNMARICLGYLNLAPFDPARTTNEICDLLRAGHYAFAFYAFAHWLDHLEKAAESLQHAKKPEDLEMQPLLEEIGHFLENNYQSPTETSAGEKSQVEGFEPFEVFGESGHVKSLIQARQAWLEFTGRDGLAEGGSDRDNTLPLNSCVGRVLACLDSLVREAPATVESLQRFHGPRLFKCPVVRCRYFHDGFKAQQDRNSHQSRHRFRFCCHFDGCPKAFFGFSSEDLLERHLGRDHHDLQGYTDDEPVTFPVLKKPDDFDINAALSRRDFESVEAWVNSYLAGAFVTMDLASVKLFLGKTKNPVSFHPWLLRLAMNGKVDIDFLEGILKLPVQIENEKDFCSIFRGRSRKMKYGEGQVLLLLRHFGGVKRIFAPVKTTSILHLMASHGEVACVRYLVEECDLDANLVNKGQTPLMAAAEMGQIGVVDFLLNGGHSTREHIDIQIKGKSAGFLAAANSHDAVIRTLYPTTTHDSEGARLLAISRFRKAAIAGDLSTVDRMAREGFVDVDTPDVDGVPPIRHAAHNYHEAVVLSMLSSWGNKINFEQRCWAEHPIIIPPNHLRAFLFCIATIKGNAEIVRRLISPPISLPKNGRFWYREGPSLGSLGREHDALSLAKALGHDEIANLLE